MDSTFSSSIFIHPLSSRSSNVVCTNLQKIPIDVTERKSQIVTEQIPWNDVVHLKACWCYYNQHYKLFYKKINEKKHKINRLTIIHIYNSYYINTNSLSFSIDF